MPIEKELIELIQAAYVACQAGDRKAALARLDEFSMLLSLQDAATHLEFVEMLAGIGKIYELLKESGMVALNLADVCAFAERHLPKTSDTSGDYFNLSRALDQTGDVPGALQALERAKYHLCDDPSWAQYEKVYMARKKALEAKLGGR